MIGNETGHLLECVELYGKFINNSENRYMLRRNIAANSQNFLWKTLFNTML